MQTKLLLPIFMLLVLGVSVSLLVTGSMHQQETRQRAAVTGNSMSTLTADQRRIAGIDGNGKLMTKSALLIRTLYPDQYQDLKNQGLIADAAAVDALYAPMQQSLQSVAATQATTQLTGQV